MGGPMGGPPARDPMGGPRDQSGAMREPTRDPMPPREPGMGGPGGGPRDMPPIASPPPGRVGPRPGGTMPPPMAPVPPVAPSPAATMAQPDRSDPHFPPPVPAPSPAPAPFGGTQPPPMGPPPTMPPPMSAAPMGHAPAPVVPLQADKNKPRLVGVAAKKVPGRPLSVPSKRGVHLEPLDPKIVKMLDLQSNILERLRAKLDLDKVPMDRLHEEELWQRAERATIDLIETLESSGELPKYIDTDALLKETLNEALALGPLEDLFADDNIDEILIDRRDRVVVGKNGQLRGSGKAFSSDDVFERVVKRIVHEAGATIDEQRPVVDLRMRDGTRLTAAVAPVAARGACLVLKKPASQMPSLADLVSQGTLSSGMADFLATCVAARRNVLVCGAPGSGKTAVLAALAAASPPGERVVSIEDVGELNLAREEWIQLETRPSSPKAPEIDLAALLETAMRLMPDRLVVGEVRGREAMPLISALNSSIDGAVVAMTGEGANAVLNRLATLARATQPVGADSAIRELTAGAFEIVLHVGRNADGSVRIHTIEEITGVSDTTFETQVVFRLDGASFVATGTVPRFYSELEARGIPADQAVFR
ncbi:MAG TPA: ATPase, T2SS/T4P/T4SS family, partial [Kofleriaceae bacterium]|nr:ATPase, T2SS/T4P/T4SS family [Kofleriaceae bacterium]